MPRRKNTPDKSRNMRSRRKVRRGIEQQEQRRSKQQEQRRSKKQRTRTKRRSGRQMRRQNQPKTLLSFLLYTSLLNSALGSGADSNTKIIIESDVFDENGVVIPSKPGLMSIIERTLPPDVVSGQRIKMKYQGTDFYITVPADAIPGEVIQIKIPIKRCSQSETAEYLTSFVDPYGETPCDQRISDSTAFYTTRFGIAFGVMGLALALEAGGSSLAIEGVKEAVAGGQMVPTVGKELARTNMRSQLGLTSGGVGTALSEPALSNAVNGVEEALREMGGEAQFKVVENPKGIVVNTNGGVKPEKVPGESLLRKTLKNSPKQTGNLPKIDIEGLNKWDNYKQEDIKIYKARPTDRGYITKEGLKDIPKGPTAYSESVSAAQRNAVQNENLFKLGAPETTRDWKPPVGLKKPPGSTMNPNPHVSFSDIHESVQIPKFRTSEQIERVRAETTDWFKSGKPDFIENMKSLDKYAKTQFDPNPNSPMPDGGTSSKVYKTAFNTGYKGMLDPKTDEFYFVPPDLPVRHPEM